MKCGFVHLSVMSTLQQLLDKGLFGPYKSPKNKFRRRTTVLDIHKNFEARDVIKSSPRKKTCIIVFGLDC